MTITLTPNQERVIEEAIRAGLVRSVDEFIEVAIEVLPHHLEHAFDLEKARKAGESIRELRKGVKQERDRMSFRELAHLGHRY